ncbi:MAG: hypothetical protein ACYSX0_01760 [Planctomycetota bacterium]
MPRSPSRQCPKESPGPGQRAVGLDKPCSQCGQPIYYNYKGPVEGICGRCTDRALRNRRIERTRTVVRGGSSGRGTRLLALLVAFLAGAAAMYLAYPYLPH